MLRMVNDLRCLLCMDGSTNTSHKINKIPLGEHEIHETIIGETDAKIARYRAGTALGFSQTFPCCFAMAGVGRLVFVVFSLSRVSGFSYVSSAYNTR